jgi:hypothetical protein
MGATYRVTLSDVNGTPLVDVPFTSLKYSRVTNDVSTLVMELPSTFNTQLIRIPDGRVEVWRKIDGGREYLDTETTWLIKKLGFKRNAQGLVTTLSRRIRRSQSARAGADRQRLRGVGTGHVRQRAG